MDPVDLQAFLLHAPVVRDDIVLLSILADVWEPLPVQCLAQNFVSLTSSYTAADVAQAFRAALDMITSRPGSYDEADVCSHHYDVLCMGGMCRHFGFRNVGKRLGLLEHVDDDAPRLVARQKSTISENLATSLCTQAQPTSSRSSRITAVHIPR
jgi:hypothetical protein